jgi:hypothetical protein
VDAGLLAGLRFSSHHLDGRAPRERGALPFVQGLSAKFGEFCNA